MEKKPKSWRSWLLTGTDGELLIRERSDRRGVILELHGKHGAQSTVELDADAWSVLCDLKYFVDIDQVGPSQLIAEAQKRLAAATPAPAAAANGTSGL